METIVLARGPKRTSFADAKEWFSEYACLIPDENERREIRENYRPNTWNTFIFARRRVKENEFGEWEILDFAESVEDAANNGCDTDYWQGESLHDLHAGAVERVKRERETTARLKELESRRDDLRDYLNERYIDELRSRRLYSKAKKNEAPQDIIDEIKTRLETEYHLALSKINDEIELLSNIKTFYV